MPAPDPTPTDPGAASPPAAPATEVAGGHRAARNRRRVGLAAVVVAGGLVALGWVDGTAGAGGTAAPVSAERDRAPGRPAPPPGHPLPAVAERDRAPGASAPPADPSPAVGVRSARMSEQPAEQVAVPTAIRIEGIDLDTRVVPVGVTGTGEMAAPDDLAAVGWYRHGPVPGDDGSAVLGAHVDFGQRPGAFFRLTQLQPGDLVELDLADGATQRFRVVDSEVHDKRVLPVDEVFARGGTPTLRLLTCGGDFDHDRRSYRANVVVTAEPA